MEVLLSEFVNRGLAEKENFIGLGASPGILGMPQDYRANLSMPATVAIISLIQDYVVVTK
jgi:hypothetical protein